MAPRDAQAEGSSSEEVASSQQATSSESLPVTPRGRKVRKASRRPGRSKSRNRPKKYSTNGRMTNEELIAEAEAEEREQAKAKLKLPPPREITSSAKTLAKQEALFDSPRRICVRELLSGNSPSPEKTEEGKLPSLKKAMMPNLNDFVPPPIDDSEFDTETFGDLSSAASASTPRSRTVPENKGGNHESATSEKPKKNKKSQRRSRSVARSSRVVGDEVPASPTRRKRISLGALDMDSAAHRKALAAASGQSGGEGGSPRIRIRKKSAAADLDAAFSIATDLSAFETSDKSKRRSKSVARCTRVADEVPSSPTRTKRVPLKSLGKDSSVHRRAFAAIAKENDAGSEGGSPRFRIRKKVAPVDGFIQPTIKTDKSQRRSRSVARSTRVEEELPGSPIRSPTRSKRISLRSLGMESSAHRRPAGGGSVHGASVASASPRLTMQREKALDNDDAATAPMNSSTADQPPKKPQKTISPSGNSNRVSLKMLGMDASSHRRPRGGSVRSGSTSSSGRSTISHLRKKGTVNTLAVPFAPDSPETSKASPKESLKKTCSPTSSPIRGGRASPPRINRHKLSGPPGSPTRRSIRVKSLDDNGKFVLPADLLASSPERSEGGKSVVRVAVRMRRQSLTK